MATPILVLLLSLPLLRPLLLPAGATPRERILIESVQSLIEGRGMALDPMWRGEANTVTVGERTFAARPPVFAILLAGPAWLLQHFGYEFEHDESVFSFWLTFFGVVLPTAIGAGVVYRMGRLFELSRPMRSLLALLCVMASGWISYATVLNPYAPAAGLIMLAVAMILYTCAARRPGRVIWLLLLSGHLAALACAIDPWTFPIVLPLALVIAVARLSITLRLIGILLMTLGAMPVIWLHCAWSLTIFGSIVPPGSADFVQEMTGTASDSIGQRLTSILHGLWISLIGRQGIFTHFPLLVAAVGGLITVLRRHWPMHAKMLAAVTFVGAVTIIMIAATHPSRLDGSTFALSPAVAILPLLMFWLGALLRKRHSALTRVAMIALGSTSIFISLAGARGPIPLEPYQRHTAVAALQRWIEVDPKESLANSR